MTRRPLGAGRSVVVHFRLGDGLDRRLRAHCVLSDVLLAEVVRAALERHLGGVGRGGAAVRGPVPVARSVKISQALAKRLRSRAADDGVSVSSVLCDALERYLTA